jgi:hypothetical protein
MSARSTLAWFTALMVGLLLAADYGLISHILAELGVIALIAWVFRLFVSP